MTIIFLEAINCCTAKVLCSGALLWSTHLFIHNLSGHFLLVLSKSSQDIAVELSIGGLTWRDRFLLDNLVNVEKADQHWFHIAFHLLHLLWPGWGWTVPPGWLPFCISVVPINPTFITRYDLEKEVWVIADLLLKFCDDFQLMLLLVIGQQSWHEFCSILPHVEFDKIHSHVPYGSPTLLQTSWIVCLWSSHTFATLSCVVPAEGHPEHLSSSTDIQPFLNC